MPAETAPAQEPVPPHRRALTRYLPAVFVLAVAALWYLVFRCTGLLWWDAPDPYPRKLEPPPPLYTPLPTFEGTDPKLQHLTPEMQRKLKELPAEE